MQPPPQPDYGRGDPVAWHASTGHGAGTGIIVDVLTTDAGVEYVVHKLVDGQPTGQTLTLKEVFVYPTRSLTDTRPQPAVHRHPPR
jgi:hypothetical protein